MNNLTPEEQAVLDQIQQLYTDNLKFSRGYHITLPQWLGLVAVDEDTA
jgi:hypothetical protein